MNILYVQSSRISPEVRLNTEEKILQLIGRSSPENAIEFYQRIYHGIERYFEQEDHLTVNMMFEYFNTSSSKCLFGLFRQLKSFLQDGKEVDINWFYEEYDEDMLETGEDFMELIDLDLNMIEIPEGDDVEEHFATIPR